jgi:hypothetical protein
MPDVGFITETEATHGVFRIRKAKTEEMTVGTGTLRGRAE